MNLRCYFTIPTVVIFVICQIISYYDQSKCSNKISHFECFQIFLVILTILSCEVRKLFICYVSNCTVFTITTFYLFRLLEKSLSEIPKQYAAAVWSTAPRFAAQVARKFLQKNFNRVYNTFTGIDEFMFRAVLDGSFDTVNTQEDLDQVRII